jgi:(p)ppGpp synthase/HD superfamily hydrolase
MDSDSSYLTDLTIKVIKGKNQLLDIITKASQKDVYIESVKTIEDTDCTIFAVTIKTTNAMQLENFISDLKSLPFLLEVERKRKI